MTEESKIAKISLTDYEKKAIDWASRYANDVQGIEKVVLNSEPYRYCVWGMYREFVIEGKIKAIEKISTEEREGIYAECNRLFPSAPKEARKQICIFLYFMNYIFENYF